MADPGSDQRPVFKGTVTARFGSWQVGVDTTSDKKRCFAYVVAASVAPEGARDERPAIYFSVTPNSTGASHSIDTAKVYDRTAKLTALVNRRGNNVSVPAVFDADGDVVKMNENCNQDRSKMCISRTALCAVTDGTELVLSGKTTDHQDSKATFLLNGYKSAIQEMNRLCENAKGTAWLIQEGCRR
jgi:hypothetical protein